METCSPPERGDGTPSRVAIVIVNWKGWKDTLECLESLYRITYPLYDILIIDNDSQDESVERIREYCRGGFTVTSPFLAHDPAAKPIRLFEYTRREAVERRTAAAGYEDIPSSRRCILLKNDTNAGFAEGNNIAIRYALSALRPRYVLLLNNDIVVDPNFLTELVDYMENNPTCGFCGPKQYFYDYEGRSDVINMIGGRLSVTRGETYHIGMGEADVGQYETPFTVDFIEGSSLLARTGILEEVGLLETSYFLYWEDVDLCIRGRRAGYTSAAVPKSRIWHKVAASSRSVTHAYYWTRNRFRFMRRFSRPHQYLLFIAYALGYRFWAITAEILLCHRSVEEYKAYLSGLYHGITSRS